MAYALQAQLLSFVPWLRRDPPSKPIISSWVWTAAGPRLVIVMLYTGALHCFTCADLAHALSLPTVTSSAPGPAAITPATPDATRAVPPPPVVVHLALGDSEALREVIDMSPLDLGPELDIILGWDWLSSLRFLYPPALPLPTRPRGRHRAPKRTLGPPPSHHLSLGAHRPWRIPPQAPGRGTC